MNSLASISLGLKRNQNGLWDFWYPSASSVLFFQLVYCTSSPRSTRSLAVMLSNTALKFSISCWRWHWWQCHLETWGGLAGLVVFVVGECFGISLVKEGCLGFLTDSSLSRGILYKLCLTWGVDRRSPVGLITDDFISLKFPYWKIISHHSDFLLLNLNNLAASGSN